MRPKLKWIVFFVAAMVLIYVPSCLAQQVGYINLQRLVSESKMGQSAKADIQKLRKAKEDDLAKKNSRTSMPRRMLSIRIGRSFHPEISETAERTSSVTTKSTRGSSMKQKKIFFGKTGKWSPLFFRKPMMF